MEKTRGIHGNRRESMEKEFGQFRDQTLQSSYRTGTNDKIVILGATITYNCALQLCRPIQLPNHQTFFINTKIN